MRLEIFLSGHNFKGPVRRIKEIGCKNLDDFGMPDISEILFTTIITFYENGRVNEQIYYNKKGVKLSNDIQTFYKTGSRIEINDYDESGRPEVTEILYYNRCESLIKNKKIEYD